MSDELKVMVAGARLELGDQASPFKVAALLTQRNADMDLAEIISIATKQDCDEANAAIARKSERKLELEIVAMAIMKSIERKIHPLLDELSRSQDVKDALARFRANA